MKVFGFAGFSGAGKTTLIERVVPCLVNGGLRVSLIKHAHHEFDIDRPGKDSWRHRRAGCSDVLVVSPQRVALMRELRGAPEPDLDRLVRMLAPCDLVLIEGYKHAPLPKIEVRRAARPAPALHHTDPWVVAVASDGIEDTHLRTFALEEHEAIAAFICRYLALARPSRQQPRRARTAANAVRAG